MDGVTGDKPTVVLTIDDEKHIRQSFRLFLEDYDYEVLEAEDGRSGIEIFERERPDLVLIDLRMPETHGLDVLAAVTASAPETPVIVISGTGMITDVVEALRLGAWDYLLKPVHDLLVLHHAVEKVLERARLRRENLAHQQHLEAEVKRRTLALEESNRALQAALRETAEARDSIQTILHSVGDGILVVDNDRRILMMNRVAETILERSLHEVAGQPIETALGDPSLIEAFEACFTSTSGSPSSVEIGLSLFREGAHRQYQACTTPLSRDGSVGGRLISLRDVTREREIDRMKSEFISTAAHELRTPLTAVMGFSELLLSGSGFGEEQQMEYLSIIHEKSRTLESIVDDLLDLRRVESGEVIRVKKELCDIGSVIEGATSDYGRACGSHRFTTELPAIPVELEADERKIVQVMENLLGNAVKFSPEGNQIRVSCELSDGAVCIAVSDLGIGMTPEEAERVFDKFYRVDSSNTAVAGLGLGMAIVKSIVEAHDGSIHVESEPGRGTRVTFRLPVAYRDTELDPCCRDTA